LRWLRIICEALEVLHRNGLIHGDVSPRNLIVSGSELVLTDYDFAAKIGEPMAAPGTILYCSASYQERRPASPSDDIYAPAASFFQVVFEKEPFRHGGGLDKKRGLNWEGVNREGYPTLVAFLSKATNSDPVTPS
jgi:serine/threonine protein kinase